MTVHRLSRVYSLLVAGFVLLCSTLVTFGQQSFGGHPLMMHEGSLRSQVAVRNVNLDFNPSDYMVRDTWTGGLQTKPLSVGRVIEYQANFAEEAQLIGAIDGRNVYRLEIQVEGNPVGCNLYYNDFYIPMGGKLYIYTPDGKELLGAYTNATHKVHGAFATEPISGNTLILDYEAPVSGEMPSIDVQGVGYFYHPILMVRSGEDQHREFEDRSDPGLRRYCQINANCPEGNPYQAQKASSVAMIMVLDRGISVCSGNLVNNLAEDFTPYVMTAAHCASTTKNFTVSSLDLAKWIFSFHYEKPRCSSGDYATTREVSMVGAEMKSFLPMVGYSDGLLLKISEDIPLDYRVYYSGWDASPTVWPRGASIHHPAGDAAKISTFDGNVQVSQWVINSSVKGGADDHFGFNFKAGNTEGGSSGSPLFNADGYQIGTLTGGLVGICPMDAMYGRLNSHFDKYKAKAGTWYMAKWLDPQNTGAKKVSGTWRNGYEPLDVVPSIIGTIDPGDASKIHLSWKAVPAHAQGYAIQYNLYRNGRRIATKTETTHEDILTNEMKTKGQVAYAVEAVYTIDGKEVATPAAHYTVYTGQLVSRVHPTVSTAKKGVKIKWQMPYNTQVVTKVKNRDKVAPFKAPHGLQPILSNYAIPERAISRVFMYDSYRVAQSPFNGQKLYIHQINFIPSQDTPYTSDGRIIRNKNISFFVRQKIDDTPIQYFDLIVPKGTAQKKQFFSYQLSMPVEISDAHLLDVGFAFDPAHLTGDIYLDGNSKDEKVSYDACKLAFDFIDPDYGIRKFYVWQEPYSAARMAYQALELVISDNPRRQGGVTNRYYTRGSLPVPFPTVKSYVLYRNGAKVMELPAETLMYEDAEGKTTDDYYVEVVYNYPKELRPNDQVSQVTPEVRLYPAHFTTQLQLTDATEVETVELYSMEGVRLVTFAGDRLMGILDVTTLPAGQYIAIIRTTGGVQTQRLVK